MEVNDVLVHYGIPGMRWGRRRSKIKVRSKVFNTKKQVARDEKNLKRLNNGEHARIGFTKKRQEKYDQEDKAYLEKNIQKNKAKLAKKCHFEANAALYAIGALAVATIAPSVIKAGKRAAERTITLDPKDYKVYEDLALR